MYTDGKPYVVNLGRYFGDKENTVKLNDFNGTSPVHMSGDPSVSWNVDDRILPCVHVSWRNETILGPYWETVTQQDVPQSNNIKRRRWKKVVDMKQVIIKCTEICFVVSKSFWFH